MQERAILNNKTDAMVTIRTLKVSAPFSYLWLKHVTGVNLAVHCAHCLLGEYDPRIKANLTEVANITLPYAPYHYLCGVSRPYVWNRNFHLAFREKEGSLLTIQRNGIYIEIENAEEVKFSMADADPNRPALPEQELPNLPQPAVCVQDFQVAVNRNAPSSSWRHFRRIA
ncbi:MAG: hypothetical protein E7030_01305 [Akkermansiaceae bacterium]|nr:hypothetical protein [Akkermansiaceae bacterium]